MSLFAILCSCHASLGSLSKPYLISAHLLYGIYSWTNCNLQQNNQYTKVCKYISWLLFCDQYKTKNTFCQRSPKNTSSLIWPRKYALHIQTMKISDKYAKNIIFIRKWWDTIWNRNLNLIVRNRIQIQQINEFKYLVVIAEIVEIALKLNNA